MAETVHTVVPHNEWIDLSAFAGVNGQAYNSGNSTLVYVKAVAKPAADSTKGNRIHDDGKFDYIVDLPDALWIRAINASGIVSVTPGVASVERTELQKTAFDELSVAELTPVFQYNFNYNINPELFSIKNNHGSAVIENSLAKLSTGAVANQSSTINSLRAIKYASGQGTVSRLSGVFTTGVIGSTQLLGIGDAEDGLFFGYDGAQFGIVKRSFGQSEVRILTITTASTTAENITITLDGDIASVPVTASGNTTITANEIASFDYSNIGRGWETHIGSSAVIFISYDTSIRNGTYSLAGTTAVGAFVQTVAAVPAVDDWTPQTEWNKDKADGTGVLPAMDFTKGNVFQVRFKWLGFGPVDYAIENPGNRGEFIKVHTIPYLNENVIPTVSNPNMQICAAVENTSNASDIVLKLGSVSGFVEGKVQNTLFRNGYTASRTIGIATEEPVLTLRNLVLYNGKRNKNPIRVSFSSISSDGNKGVIFRYIINAELVDAVYQLIEPSISVALIDETAVSYLEGDEQFGIGLERIGHELVALGSEDILLGPGDSITITAVSASSNEVTCSFNWQELF